MLKSSGVVAEGNLAKNFTTSFVEQVDVFVGKVVARKMISTKKQLLLQKPLEKCHLSNFRIARALKLCYKFQKYLGFYICPGERDNS